MSALTPSSNLVKIQKTDNLAHAIRLMNEYQIHHLVVYEGETIEGIISDKDLLNAWLSLKTDPEKIHIGDFFKSYILEISEDATLEEAISYLNQNSATSALVRSKDSDTKIITTFDLLKLLGDEYETSPIELAQLKLANPIIQKIMSTLSDIGI